MPAATSTSIDIYGRADDLASEWDELADSMVASPFLRPGWILAWWEAFGKGKLRVFALRTEGRLTGVAAMRLQRGALVPPANWHTPLFGLLVGDPDHSSAELAQALVSEGRRRITLSFVERDGPGVAAFREAARGAGYRVAERTMLRSPYITVDGDWERYQRRLTSKRLSNLRRLRRRLEEKGDLSLEVLDGGERLESLLEEGFQVEARGWKGSGRTAILSRPDTAEFYRRVASWAAARGSLRLAFLRLSGHALAFDYCLEEGGVHYLVKTGYDERYQQFAPGVLIRQQMLERAFSSGLGAYEFLGEDKPWKLEWTDTCRERRLVHAFAPSAAGVAERAAVVYGRPLAKRALSVIGR